MCHNQVLENNPNYSTGHSLHMLETNTHLNHKTSKENNSLHKVCNGKKNYIKQIRICVYKNKTKQKPKTKKQTFASQQQGKGINPLNGTLNEKRKRTSRTPEERGSRCLKPPYGAKAVGVPLASERLTTTQAPHQGEGRTSLWSADDQPTRVTSTTEQAGDDGKQGTAVSNHPYLGGNTAGRLLRS